MLSILHKGLHISLDLDTSAFTGDVDVDSQLAYVKGLVAGKMAAIDSNGKIQLADGAAAAGLVPLGFIVQDAAGYFMLNKPAIASKQVAITFSNCVVITDQIDTSLTFTPGEALYCGTGAKAGLITNVPATGAVAIGVAGSAASAAAPQLKVLVSAL